MDVSGKSVIITGGAQGIGEALARAMVHAGARGVIADLNGDAARTLAQVIGAVGLKCDAAQETDIQSVLADTEQLFGQFDVFVSNASL